MRLDFNGVFPFIHRTDQEVRETVNWPGASLETWFAGNGYDTTTAGVTVTSDSALKHSAYWRAINLLSSQIASFPLGLFKRLPGGDTKEIFDHPAVSLLTRQANKMMTSFIWKESTHANVLINGNGYSYIERDGAIPTALKMLDGNNVKPKTDGDELVYEYNGELIDPYFMLHIPGLSFDGIKGKAVLQVGAESMGVGLAMQKYSANFFKNGAKQTGVLTHPQSLSAKAKDGVRDSFNKKSKDEEGGTMILDEGMKYIPTGIPPDQQQLLQSKQFSVQEIARWFGIPPYLLMDESRSTFSNIENQGAEFVRYTLTQWVERWEAELNYKLLATDEQPDHFWKFNMNSLLRGSPKERAEYYAKMQEYGNMSINEARRLEELNSIPGGDKHLVQINRTTLDKIGEDGKSGEAI